MGVSSGLDARCALTVNGTRLVDVVAFSPLATHTFHFYPRESSPSVRAREDALGVLAQEAPESLVSPDELEEGARHLERRAAAECVRHEVRHGGRLLEVQRGGALARGCGTRGLGSVEHQQWR